MISSTVTDIHPCIGGPVVSKTICETLSVTLILSRMWTWLLSLYQRHYQLRQLWSRKCISTRIGNRFSRNDILDYLNQSFSSGWTPRNYANRYLVNKGHRYYQDNVVVCTRLSATRSAKVVYSLGFGNFASPNILVLGQTSYLISNVLVPVEQARDNARSSMSQYRLLHDHRLLCFLDAKTIVPWVGDDMYGRIFLT